MKFNIEYTTQNLQSNSGLGLISKILDRLPLSRLLKNYSYTAAHHGEDYSDRDIIVSQLGLLLCGHSNYEAIDLYKTDKLFKKSMGLRRLVSKERLRQRLDKLGSNHPYVEACLRTWNQKLLKKYANPGVIKETNLVPVDFDVTVLDNTGSHKEGVLQTYQKGKKGYAPMMTYIGNQGYLLDLEFRKGSSHSNCSGTCEYILRTMNLARRLVKNNTLLARFDSGNDSDENIVALSSIRNSYYLIKHVIRGVNYERIQEFECEYVMNNIISKKSFENGVNIYISEKRGSAIIGDENGNPMLFLCRQILSVIEKTRDLKTGQILIVPERKVHKWRTNLPIEEYSAEDVINLYKDHGTSEQFHSELKTDMDVERLSSGKYGTNNVLMHIAKIGFNLLRILGQCALKSTLLNSKQTKQRLRHRTVLLKLLYQPSLLKRKNKRWTIVLPRSNPLSSLYELVYNQL